MKISKSKLKLKQKNSYNEGFGTGYKDGEEYGYEDGYTEGTEVEAQFSRKAVGAVFILIGIITYLLAYKI